MFVGNLLRFGVILAAIVAAIGGIMYLTVHGMLVADYSVFRGEPDELRSLRDVVVGAFQLRSASVIQLGLLLLIATPIARVAISLVAFARQRDRMYVLITAIVLGLLLYGLIGAGV
jgi:uncharacterized membrane protein